jgi:competence protein ComEC
MDILGTDADMGQDSKARYSRNGFALPQLTPGKALALLAGAVAVQALPALPPVWLAIVLAGMSAILIFVRAADRIPFWFLAGFFWCLLRVDLYLQSRLPAARHGRDFDVVGQVQGLPQAEARSTRFEFDIESAQLDGEAMPLQGTVRLNWYDDAPEISPCSRWTLRTRLRPPRGFVNPGGHDGERGAALRGVVATGYVRSAQVNAELAADTAPCIDAWRGNIARAIDGEFGQATSRGLLRALAVGDQSGIQPADWQVLRATGVGHLIAISGLHVGMFAALGALLARLLWKCWPRLTLRVPGPLLEAPVAMACAFGYGLLAGMGVPTLRTLLMIAIALLARNARRGHSPVQALALAALAIVAWDPLAVLSAGFWLSFAGVAVLLMMTSPTRLDRSAWRDMPRIQLLLSVALLPLGVWFFGQGSLIGPIANLIAVPWVSFVVVPVTVLGSLLIVDWPALGAPLLHAADSLLMPLWRVLEWMAAMPMAQIHFAAAPWWALALAMLGIAWTLLPRGIPARAAGLILVLPLLLPAQSELGEGEFEAWVFDVGQGLSIFVRGAGSNLLYDAGPRYPSGFDVGDAVVVPSLHALGVTRLDRMVISHGDSDHAGGAQAVQLAFPDVSIISGEPQRLDIAADACSVGEAVRDHGIEWRVIVAEGESARSSNDRSCVILVTGRYGRLLLTGDSTAHIEADILDAGIAGDAPLVLSVPHHGSKSASSAVFLDGLSPQLGLVSAGYRNAFRHPHPDVVERYASRSIALLNTADSGYLYVRFGADGLHTQRGRSLPAGWWRMH